MLLSDIMLRTPCGGEAMSRVSSLSRLGTSVPHAAAAVSEFLRWTTRIGEKRSEARRRTHWLFFTRSTRGLREKSVACVSWDRLRSEVDYKEKRRTERGQQRYLPPLISDYSRMS